MYSFRVLALIFFCGLTLNAQPSEKELANVNTVKKFVTAFNAKNSKAMASLVVDNIEWLSIAGKEVAVEAKGMVDLVKSMDTYFKSCPTCRSQLSDIVATTNRVSAIEIASWEDKAGLKSQRAISVYEFSEGAIARVYYFPAEK